MTVVDLAIPAYISFSSYSTYQECPWLYKLTRIDGLQEQPAYWFFAGSALHHALDVIDHELLAGEPPF